MKYARWKEYGSVLKSHYRARIRRDFTRLSEDQLSRVQGTPSAFVADAYFGKGSLPIYLKPLDPNSRFAGSALTVNASMHDQFPITAALEYLQKGDVLVIATDETNDTAYLGEHMVTMAKNRGAVAIVTDGLIRDIREVSRIMPCFCKGSISGSPYSIAYGEVGLPITIGNVLISSGDLLVGDLDGIVHVPHAEVDEMTERLKSLQSLEDELSRELAKGTLTTLMDQYGEYEDQIEYV